MIKVIGVRFRTAGKIYFFDPLDFEINKGDHVIVETARGIEFGTVMNGIKEVTDDEVVQPLKPVLRVATERDVKQEAENKVREKEAYRVCLEKIREHGLDMKLIDAEYTFDNNKVLFYFTADGRIDFRELVKDLAAIFKTRIELRQIGVRDETKMMGGIGMCGRPLCCHAHLSDFIPVSIKMAKEQNLSLNPTKISGVCGRLMCCLKHEEDTYEELNKSLPNVGDRVTCPDGKQGEVTSVNVLRELVKVVIEDDESKEIHEYKSVDLKFVKKGYRQVKAEISTEELRALELLEKQDKLDSQEAGDAERPARKERKERTEQSEQGERKEHKERTEQPEQGERKERKERHDRKDRKERKERTENGAAEVKDDAPEKKNRNKDRNRNKEKQPVENGKEQEVVHASKEVTEAAVEVTAGEATEGTQPHKNHHKKPYYRNRRRNRPEGAKEQHES